MLSFGVGTATTSRHAHFRHGRAVRLYTIMNQSPNAMLVASKNCLGLYVLRRCVIYLNICHSLNLAHCILVIWRIRGQDLAVNR